jgi:hypothetical protein
VYNYKYKPRIIDDAEYKIIEATSNIDDGSYIIKNRHGYLYHLKTNLCIQYIHSILILLLF